MKRIHPNIARIALVAMLIFLSGHIGCKTPTGGVANPFLAPDRVPPPATRAVLPGQAQPYYPGDPLPVMQSSVAPQVEPTQQAGLAWGASNGVATASKAAPSSGALASSNENVAIPSDKGDLRFEASQPEAPLQTASSNQGPAVTPASAAATHSVVSASFNQPVGGQLPTDAPDVTLVDAEVVSPWRPPQISQSVAVGPSVTSPPRVAIPGGEPSGMGVRLRAIPSPPPTNSEPAAPRIRLPGYYTTQPYYPEAALPPGSVMYGAPAMQSFNNAPQPVQPSPISLAGAPQGPQSQDGFRPRTAMR
jgi:hypothetical protein